MKYMNAMLVVRDLEKSKAFYREVLGMQVVTDMGANVVLTGGLSLLTLEHYAAFLSRPEGDFHFGGSVAELYFEEDDFDGFIEKLKGTKIDYLHPVYEQSWGQRTIRFYDPDRHIIEVGENMKTVCGRFIGSGMSVDETAKRMDVPVSYIRELMK